MVTEGLASSSLSLCILGVNLQLSTSTANGGCQPYKIEHIH